MKSEYNDIELKQIKELLRNKCMNNFVFKMRRYINKLIKTLEKNESFKRTETINLLKQSEQTILNVFKLVKNKSVVDANCLLRSAFENIIMGMMIYYDEDTYNEFIDLSIDEDTRNYTKPHKLRKNFRKILRQLDGDFFLDINNRNLKEMLDDFYNQMCSYAHSSLFVNAVVEMEKNNNLDAYVVGIKWDTYFVEFLLYLCLKKLCNYSKEPLDYSYTIIGFFILVSDIPPETTTNNYNSEVYKLLYGDNNKKFLDKNKKNTDFLINKMKELQKMVQDNPETITQLINRIITS